MANQTWLSPYEDADFLARVEELKSEGRTEHDALLIADGEFHSHVGLPPGETAH